MVGEASFTLPAPLSLSRVRASASCAVSSSPRSGSGAGERERENGGFEIYLWSTIDKQIGTLTFGIHSDLATGNI